MFIETPIFDQMDGAAFLEQVEQEWAEARGGKVTWERAVATTKRGSRALDALIPQQLKDRRKPRLVQVL